MTISRFLLLVSLPHFLALGFIALTILCGGFYLAGYTEGVRWRIKNRRK